MKKIKRRSAALFLVLLLIAAGIGLYTYKLVIFGETWANFSANQGVYIDGTLKKGRLYDRNGTLLVSITDGEMTFADDELLRISTLHAVGDRYGNIGTGALSAFAAKLTGYDFFSGIYSGEDGEKLTLTIDAELCRSAYQALDGKSGVIAICDYTTGEILCMVSSPSYDPNYPPEDIESNEGYDGAYINRFLSSTFVPGSVFKIVTLAAAIETMPDLFDRVFTCEGSFSVGPDEIVCSGYHGDLKIEDAFAVSCNCVFGTLAMELGAETLSRYAAMLGLTDTFSINDIPTMPGSLGQMSDGTANVAWSGIGQHLDLVNPAAMLQLVSVIANGGTANSLTLIKHTHSEASVSISPSTAAKIGEMMGYNVSKSYGESRFEGLELHAKSGTAELGADISPHAWFVGYIDNDNHKLAFVVMVENGGGGSSVAGGIANTVLQYAIKR